LNYLEERQAFTWRLLLSPQAALSSRWVGDEVFSKYAVNQNREGLFAL